MALVASELLDGGDDPWLRAKVDTAAFYAEQLLPRVAGLPAAVGAGARTMFAIDPETMGVAK
jgi:hypothetical protein